MGVKICTLCRLPKPLDAFPPKRRRSGTYGWDSFCASCKAHKRRSRYERDAKAEAAAATKWKKTHPVRARVQRLKHYSAVRGLTGDKGDLTADEWEEILESYRDEKGRHRCAYCARPTRRIDLQIDHVLAVSRGGRNTRSNVVPACSSCNASKCDRDRWPTLDSPHLTDTLEPAEVTEEALRFP